MPTQNNQTPMLPQDEEGITGQGQEIIDVVNDAIASGDIKAPAKLEVEDITALTDEQLNGLKCGDVVVKLTGNLKHSYKVTYKEEEQGICISYFACGYTETVAYDCVDGHWVYNSTDIKVIEDVIANPTLAGTESALEGLQVGNTKYKVGVAGATVVELIFNNVLHAPYYIYMTSTQFNGALERLSEMMSTEVTKENLPTIFASLDSVTKGYLWFLCHLACISYNFDGIQVAKVGQKTVETADDTVFAWVAGLQGGQVVWTEQTNNNLSDATLTING